MQIGKTGESLNGSGHELPNATPFFFRVFSSYALFVSNLQFYEWPLLKGVWVILLIKDFYCAIT